MLLWLTAGFALSALSHTLERVGDTYPTAAEGVSWGRLAFHGTALIVLLGAVACLVRGGLLAFREIMGRQPRSSATEGGPSAPDAEPAFDPDAALAHYFASKEAQMTPEARITQPKSPPGGFGRWRL
jgi:hypothetical protein